MASAVTPFEVAPPLLPAQYRMHGGDCGSSIWRSGGGPTQFFTKGPATCRIFGGGAGGGFAPAPAPPPPPPPWPLLAAAAPGGACLMTCDEFGENSAAV